MCHHKYIVHFAVLIQAVRRFFFVLMIVGGLITLGCGGSTSVSSDDIIESPVITAFNHQDHLSDATSEADTAYAQTSALLPHVSAGDRRFFDSSVIAMLPSKANVMEEAITIRSDRRAIATSGIEVFPRVEEPLLVALTPLNLTLNVPMRPIELTNDGGGKLTRCEVQPALPEGLSLSVSADGSTCTISGTPLKMDTNSLEVFTLSAINRHGQSDISLTLNVMPGLATPILANAGPVVYSVGRAITPLRFVNTGGSQLSSCTVDGLPLGLQVNVVPPVKSRERRWEELKRLQCILLLHQMRVAATALSSLLLSL